MCLPIVALLLVRFVGPPSASAAPGAESTTTRKELSKAETEALVRRDLSARLRIPAAVPRVVESSGRTWPDGRLGCVVRHGLEDSAPLPGYRFVLEVDGKRHTYHTDRAGHVVRCQDPKKPLGPIVR